jgi:hypothetical protein
MKTNQFYGHKLPEEPVNIFEKYGPINGYDLFETYNSYSVDNRKAELGIKLDSTEADSSGPVEFYKSVLLRLSNDIQRIRDVFLRTPHELRQGWMVETVAGKMWIYKTFDVAKNPPKIAHSLPVRHEGKTHLICLDENLVPVHPVNLTHHDHVRCLLDLYRHIALNSL